MATTSQDQYVRVWRREGLRKYLEVLSDQGSFQKALFSPDGKTLIAQEPTRVQFWPLNPRSVFQNLSHNSVAIQVPRQLNQREKEQFELEPSGLQRKQP